MYSGFDRCLIKLPGKRVIKKVALLCHLRYNPINVFIVLARSCIKTSLIQFFCICKMYVYKNISICAIFLIVLCNEKEIVERRHKTARLRNCYEVLWALTTSLWKMIWSCTNTFPISCSFVLISKNNYKVSPLKYRNYPLFVMEIFSDDTRYLKFVTWISFRNEEFSPLKFYYSVGG